MKIDRKFTPALAAASPSAFRAALEESGLASVHADAGDRRDDRTARSTHDRCLAGLTARS